MLSAEERKLSSDFLRLSLSNCNFCLDSVIFDFSIGLVRRASFALIVVVFSNGLASCFVVFASINLDFSVGLLCFVSFALIAVDFSIVLGCFVSFVPVNLDFSIVFASFVPFLIFVISSKLS